MVSHTANNKCVFVETGRSVILLKDIRNELGMNNEIQDDLRYRKI